MGYTFYDELKESDIWEIGFDVSNDANGVEYERKKEERPSNDREQRRILTNSRERRRQRTLNMAFQRLRYMVPTYPREAKLSKYGILKAAIKYIKFLYDIISKMDEEMESKAQNWAVRCNLMCQNALTSIAAP